MSPNPRPFPEPATSSTPNLQFILDLSPSMITLGLGNIRALTERLGHPQRAFRSIVVAGTNGKGSVTAMVAELLAGEGLRIGRYTSPHIYEVNERICIDGRPVSLDDIERAAARIVPLHDDIGYSYFEGLTAIAFLLFAEAAVDVAVLETGLGGRFDATNAVEPVVSAITSIAVDHRRLLGDTEEEILREKLGIARPGVPLITGVMSAELMPVLEEKATREGIPLRPFSGAGSAACTGEGLDFTRARFRTARGDYGEVTIPFPGPHQVDNALLAFAIAEEITGGRLRGAGESLPRAFMPGRFQRVERSGKTFVLDVAHNDAALSATAGHFARFVPRADAALVFGLLRRKELFRFPERLRAQFARVYLVPARANADGTGFEPHELFARYLMDGFRDGATDAILWNQSDAGAWRRLCRSLAQPASPHRFFLVMGSHHVVEHFGKALEEV